MVLQRDKPAPPPTPAREAPGNQGWKSNFLAVYLVAQGSLLKLKDDEAQDENRTKSEGCIGVSGERIDGAARSGRELPERHQEIAADLLLRTQ